MRSVGTSPRPHICGMECLALFDFASFPRHLRLVNHAMTDVEMYPTNYTSRQNGIKSDPVVGVGCGGRKSADGEFPTAAIGKSIYRTLSSFFFFPFCSEFFFSLFHFSPPGPLLPHTVAQPCYDPISLFGIFFFFFSFLDFSISIFFFFLAFDFLTFPPKSDPEAPPSPRFLPSSIFPLHSSYIFPPLPSFSLSSPAPQIVISRFFSSPFFHLAYQHHLPHTPTPIQGILVIGSQGRSSIGFEQPSSGADQPGPF